jgi:hypothetical protein
MEGFRAAFRRPLFTVAEITWRWVVGATATVLFFFGLFEFLDTLPVTDGEVFFLRTGQPVLVSQAVAHILRGSVYRGVLSLILAVLLLTLIWMVAASLGRLAILEAILEYFRERFRDLSLPEQRNQAAAGARHPGRVSTLLRLSFLRVAVALAAMVGLAGAWIISGFASSPDHPSPELVFVLFLPLAALVCLIWYVLNWLLSLASVFVVRDGEHALGSVSSAVRLCRERTAAVFAVSTWTGVAHLIAFVGAGTVVTLPLALAAILPWRLAVLGVFLVTLAYLAVADWLYTARLAGYVSIAELPDAEAIPQSGGPPVIEPSATIDRDELILSDVPVVRACQLSETTFHILAAIRARPRVILLASSPLCSLYTLSLNLRNS